MEKKDKLVLSHALGEGWKEMGKHAVMWIDKLQNGV